MEFIHWNKSDITHSRLLFHIKSLLQNSQIKANVPFELYTAASQLATQLDNRPEMRRDHISIVCFSRIRYARAKKILAFTIAICQLQWNLQKSPMLICLLTCISCMLHQTGQAPGLRGWPHVSVCSLVLHTDISFVYENKLQTFPSKLDLPLTWI